MNTKAFNLENIIAAILLLLVVTKYQLINFIETDFSFQNLLVISFFLFSIVGIIGIFLQKHWGYFAIYVFILISSFALGIAPIPFIINLFPIQAATLIVILSSAILFLITLFLQLKKVKSLNNAKTA